MSNIKNFEEEYGLDVLFGSTEDFEDATREVEDDEIIYNWKKAFNNIKELDYNVLIKRAIDIVDLPDIESNMDYEEAKYIYSRIYNAYNSLSKIALLIKKNSNEKKRALKEMQSILMARTDVKNETGRKGYASEKLAEFIRKSGDADDASEIVDKLYNDMTQQYYMINGIIRSFENQSRMSGATVGSGDMVTKQFGSESQYDDPEEYEELISELPNANSQNKSWNLKNIKEK